MKRNLFLLLGIIVFLLGGCTLAPKTRDLTLQYLPIGRLVRPTMKRSLPRLLPQ